MLNWIKRLFGYGKAARAQQWERYVSSDRFARLKAKYDAVADNDSRHWANADSLSANSANSLEVRAKARVRSRYEAANSSHLRGLTLTVTNDVIGTGPRLQIIHDDEAFCNAIETPWNNWYEEIGLAETLYTFYLSSVVSGEGCGMLIRNDQLMSPVQLDINTFETDRITDPLQNLVRGKSQVDGIELDANNRPVAYYVLKEHPGESGFGSLSRNEYTRVPARNMLHFFRQDRPEQYRGMPETVPALPLFAQIRRYTLAVLAAAEIAADFAAFIHTDAPPGEEDDYVAPDRWDTTNIDKAMMTVLPHQWKVTQLRAEQPTTTHSEFIKGLLREAFHAMLVPYNIGNADFEGDSYAGGRMALQVYQRYCKVRRAHLANCVLNKIFAAWYAEAILIPGLLPASAPQHVSLIQRAWHYDKWGHVDPIKEANAIGVNLQNGTTTLADECAEEGKDWRDVMRQRAKEKALAKELGLDVEPTAKPKAPAEIVHDNENDADEAEVQHAIAA